MASLYDTSYKGFSLSDTGSSLSFVNPTTSGFSLAETDKYNKPLSLDSFNIPSLDVLNHSFYTYH